MCLLPEECSGETTNAKGGMAATRIMASVAAAGRPGLPAGLKAKSAETARALPAQTAAASLAQGTPALARSRTELLTSLPPQAPRGS